MNATWAALKDFINKLSYISNVCIIVKAMGHFIMDLYNPM